jgi:homoserine kinase
MASEDPGVLIEVEGEGQEAIPRDASHLVARAMALAFQQIRGRCLPGSAPRCPQRESPMAAGSGSSAAAIAGGLVLARGLVSDGSQRFGDEDVLQWASMMESRTRTTSSAALHGGVTFALARSRRPGCLRPAGPAPRTSSRSC